MSNLAEIIETLQEVERLHQLNLELLEQLNVISGWLIEHGIPIPNPHTLYSLLAKAKALLNEIQTDEPKILQYKKLADEKKHIFRTDDKGTEPDIKKFKRDSANAKETDDGEKIHGILPKMRFTT